MKSPATQQKASGAPCRGVDMADLAGLEFGMKEGGISTMDLYGLLTVLKQNLNSKVLADSVFVSKIEMYGIV